MFEKNGPFFIRIEKITKYSFKELLGRKIKHAEKA